MPGLFEDLEHADCIVLVRSNLAWCHPVLYQRLAAARAALGTRVVVIDPRRTATCDIADLHLPLAPGSDSTLFNLLLAKVGRPVWPPGRPRPGRCLGRRPCHAAGATALPHSALSQFLDLWCRSKRVVTAYSQGINQATAAPTR